jgi:hypothetical protein
VRLVGNYSDPWTAQRAARARQSLLRRRAFGEAPSLAPPASRPPNFALVVGWGAVVLVAAGIFYAATTGAGTKAGTS